MDAFRNQRTPFVQPKTPVPKTPTPKAPRVTIPRAPVITPTDTAMSAFRTALAQLQQSTPQVDAAAIRAPYAASEQITGQLGQGYQQAEQQAGLAAQNQYAAGRDAAQQHAAQFGISAGAGANPTALQDTGTGSLASQTAAYQAAAPAATAQWQALLERTAGARVGDAELQRAQGLTAAKQALSTSLPGAIGNEEDRAFQRLTQRQNMALAGSQLTAKQIADARQYGLDLTKLGIQQDQFKTTTGLRRDALTEKTGTDAAKLKISKDTLALRKRAAAVSATGLKGVPAAVKALAGTPGKTGLKPVIGHNVTFPSDPAGVNAGAPALVMYVPAGKTVKPPAGYLAAATEGKPVLGQARKTGALGVTRGIWDAQYRSLIAQNQNVPGADAQIRRLLGPRPKK